MNLFKRNQVVITSLVIMIAIAGYLNFTQKNIPGPDDMMPTDSQNIEGAIVPNTENYIEVANVDDLKDDKEESNEGAEETSSQNQTDTAQPGEAIFTTNPMDEVNISDYFLTARLNREQTRARQREDYMSIINNANLTEEQKAKATDALIDLQDRIEKEAAAEDMLRAKGFTEIYVRLTGDSDIVNVVVSRNEISDAERAQIIDVVTNITKYPADKIVITPFK
ncbi:stage III sporulation protein AH [Natranaerovirga pectinivora]|uniref:Stage III sporulation protein AH n=1 Tax=Natranaerovirga pectinivora TaxID=682400 RepID=A0A4R3MRT9_9FIRM|nr:SpoIIIAH-like family protein [Natranaerovirga pectinivora]TCT16918.1 stage III sporulation protein AH [Natranaerovirga pectinivora]